MIENAVKPAPIAEVVSDCLHWLTRASIALFYPGQGEAFDFSMPKAYREWSDNPDTESGFQSSLLAQLHHSAENLQESLQKSSQNRPPKAEDFHNFMQSFEDFMSRLHMIESEVILSEQGIDALTGFKTSQVMQIEFKKELDRRARRGNPFAIAVMQIDGQSVEEELIFQVQTMATAMRKCMRSFDDIYRIGERDFAAGLKHSDIAGGIRFTERVKEELKILGTGFSFTSCVAEPDPSDDLNELMKNMNRDLSRAAAQYKGQSIRFEDVSPLQRFVNNLREEVEQ